MNFKLRPRPEREATVIATGNVESLWTNARTILDARLFPVATQIVSAAFANKLGFTADTAALLVRFAGNEKGVAFQTEQALALLKNADVVMNDTEVWKMIAASPFWSEPAESIWRIDALERTIRQAEDGSTKFDAEKSLWPPLRAARNQRHE